MKYNPVTESIVQELSSIVGPDHIVPPGSPGLKKYERDQVDDPVYAHMPEVVVKPRSTGEIARVMKLANRHRIPVTPRGAGSGLSGGATPIHGGIVIAMERMNTIIEIDRNNMTVVLEPGVVTSSLDEKLEPYGLFFAGYPMSEEFCFIGGNVAENAGGGRAIKYGVTGQYVLGIEMVTPTGEITRLGGKRFKDVTGYDLIKLMVGSEGTLGILTEITIRLTPRPGHRRALLAEFPSTAAAIDVVSAIMTDEKVIPSSAEYIDGFSYRAACASLSIETSITESQAALLFEVDGNDPTTLDNEVEAIGRVCSRRGALAVKAAEGEDERLELWKIRKRVPWALKRMTPYQSSEDISVPFAQISELADTFVHMAEEYGIPVPAFGHAADGNIHAHPMKTEEMTPEEWEAIIPEFLADLYARTAKLGGTVSGEHGIGHKRKRYMGIVTDPVALQMMKTIKTALDPNNILNPGKIFDL